MAEGTGRDDGLRALVATVDRAVDQSTGDSPAGGIGEALGPWLEGHPELPTWATVPDPSGYGQRILHTDARRGYSIAAFVWLPGQETAVHDHRSWCVTGLLTGSEVEERFELETSPAGHEVVSSRGVEVHTAGSVCVLEPPHDVHRMGNQGDEPSVSVHVYGIDLEVEATSIAHTYEDGRRDTRQT
jgi:predicted metal-dependent enzyme (double-stranded beta helix superfamily)